MKAVIDCLGDEHRIGWRAGILDLLDHPAPDGIGSEAACLLIRDAWERAARPEALPFLGEASTAHDPDDLAKHWLSKADAIVGSSPASHPHRPEILAEADILRALATLVGLPTEFIDRLTLTCLAAALDAGRGDVPGALRSHAGRVVSEKAIPALQRCLWSVNPERTTRTLVRCELVEPGGRPRVEAGPRGDDEVTFTVHVHPSWPLVIWGPGLAVIADTFVLDVLAGAPGDPRLEVLAIEFLGGGGGPVPSTKRGTLVRTGDEALAYAWSG